MADEGSEKATAYDGYGKPVQYGPDGYPLPSKGQLEQDAKNEQRIAREKAAIEQGGGQEHKRGQSRRR